MRKGAIKAEILEKLNSVREEILHEISEAEGEAYGQGLYDSILGKLHSVVSPNKLADKEMTA